jgi:hypothetical protein
MTRPSWRWLGASRRSTHGLYRSDMGAAGMLSTATAAASMAKRLTGLVFSQARRNGPASRTPLPHSKPSRRFARQCLDSAGNSYLTYTDPRIRRHDSKRMCIMRIVKGSPVEPEPG